MDLAELWVLAQQLLGTIIGLAIMGVLTWFLMPDEVEKVLDWSGIFPVSRQAALRKWVTEKLKRQGRPK